MNIYVVCILLMNTRDLEAVRFNFLTFLRFISIAKCSRGMQHKHLVYDSSVDSNSHKFSCSDCLSFSDSSLTEGLSGNVPHTNYTHIYTKSSKTLFVYAFIFIYTRMYKRIEIFKSCSLTY